LDDPTDPAVPVVDGAVRHPDPVWMRVGDGLHPDPFPTGQPMQMEADVRVHEEVDDRVEELRIAVGHVGEGGETYEVARLLAFDQRGVTFRWKDYRAKGRTRYKTMTLAAEEFMRRFLLHVLPGGFHRIRHYGLLANAARKENLALARALLHQPLPQAAPAEQTTACGSAPPLFVCRHCGGTMTIVETFARPHHSRAPPVQPGAP